MTSRPRQSTWSLLLLAALIALSPAATRAYGPQGHLIAGRAAEPLLCSRAAAVVADLGGGEDLGEIGLWADRIRSDRAYADSGPWHYMNIADDVAPERYRHPPEGDVLWAVEHYSGRLADPRLDRVDRAEALRFLVHFIVDMHQPLHVGRAEDRGGNSIDLRFDGEATNLHRLWDTHAIEWLDRPLWQYVDAISASAGDDALGSLDPLVWVAESLALRDSVYAFGNDGRQPQRAYLTFAAETTEDRLRLGARRLAGTLNELFCD